MNLPIIHRGYANLDIPRVSIDRGRRPTSARAIGEVVSMHAVKIAFPSVHAPTSIHRYLFDGAIE